jgi:hypothetical protein
MKNDKSIKIILFDGFRGAKLLRQISVIVSLLFNLIIMVFTQSVTSKVIFFMLDLDLELL